MNFSSYGGILHYNDGRAFKYVEDGSVNQYILYLLESLCICSVDLFVLISGYFLCASSRRNLGKMISLPLQVVLFKEAFYFVGVLFSDINFSLKNVLSALVPNNYFVILYLTVYIISPYINLIFEKLNKTTWTYFIFTIVLIFSVWNTLCDLAEEVFAVEWMGLSTVTAWGSKQGFNIANFILMYCIGTFIRYNNFIDKIKSKKN